MSNLEDGDGVPLARNRRSLQPRLRSRERRVACRRQTFVLWRRRCDVASALRPRPTPQRADDNMVRRPGMTQGPKSPLLRHAKPTIGQGEQDVASAADRLILGEGNDRARPGIVVGDVCGAVEVLLCSE